MTTQQRLTQIDEDWFMFPPTSGAGSDGQWWNYSTDGTGRWIPKIDKTQPKLSREEKAELMSKIAQRWKELREEKPAESRRSITLDIGNELRIPRGRVEFTLRRNGLWGKEPRAKKNRRCPAIMERERLMLEMWDAQNPDDFANRTQRCHIIAKKFEMVVPTIWSFLIANGRIEEKKRVKKDITKDVLK